MIGTRKGRSSTGNLATPPQAPQATAAAAATGGNPMLPQQEVWTSTEDLFWDHMREVQNKWNTLKLNDDIWAKLIYFEQNRRLAKAYVSTPVLTIDGSTNGLDGFRIGLSGIENSYRDLDSIACLRSIGQGIKLKIDHQGNILIRKLSRNRLEANGSAALAQAKPQQSPASSCSIWVKRWPAKGHSRQKAAAPPASSASSSGGSDYSQLSSGSQNSPASSIGPGSDQDWPATKEVLEPDQSYKLFDMQTFRAQLERNRRLATYNSIDGTSTTPIDWRQCVSIISFNRPRFADRPPPLRPAQRPGKPASMSEEQHQILTDPCWIMLINIIAIDMLKSSVCDSRSSPASQTSALINRLQSESGARNLRTAARKQRPGPEVADAQLSARLSDRKGADEAGRQRARHSAVASSQSDMKSQMGKQQFAVPEHQDATPNYAHSSERLTRLNKFRYNNQPLGLSTEQAHLQRGRGIESLLMSQPSPRSSQLQLEGSIYTTFTGKYLDKQHRSGPANERASKLASRQSSVDDFGRELGQDTDSDSHLFYPLKPERFLARRTPLVSMQAPRRGLPRPNSRQLTHSLSAFDLSHGLKLDLRVINSSSIRMNFDSDGADERGDGNNNAADAQEASRSKQERSQQPQQSARKSLKALNDEANEWASLAKKYSLNSAGESAESNSATKSTESIDNELAGEENATGSAKAELDRSENEDLFDAKENATPKKSKLQQNVSRSSIASSSSSGCADNDYFISQSSNSSMSSSTRSGEGEELSSQPASSSGIICSGNTSDEYERRHSRPEENAGGSPELFAGEQTRTDFKTNSKYRQHHQPDKAKAARRPQKQQVSSARQAISLSRANNGKSVDFSPDGMKTDFDEACPGCEHHPAFEQSVQCDCGAPSCNQMLGLGGLPSGACDCFCDCLYQPDQAHHLPSYQYDLCACGAGDKEGEVAADYELSEEPIYDHLPRLGVARNSPRPNKDASHKTRTDSGDFGKEARSQDDDIVPLPMRNADRPNKQYASTNELKRNKGWLEGRKYIKLFPKFMFSSSASSNGRNEKPTNAKKAGTLDRIDQMTNRFRRSRSSQNLSK